MAVDNAVHRAAGDPIGYAFWEPQMTGTSPGSFLSAGFLGRLLAAVAGFGSAVAMLPTAPLNQEARWASIPQDGRWYILEQPTHLPHDAGNRPDSWPQLAGKIAWLRVPAASAHCCGPSVLSPLALSAMAAI